MDNSYRVAYCGLYCGLCEQWTRIPEHARALMQSMQKAEYEDWGPGIEGFNEFWTFLKGLIEVPDNKCCRSNNCGAPFCAIRKCTISKGIEACPERDRYPCDRIKTLARSESTLIHDGERMKEIGVEAWIGEQEQRREDGFCYADVRCPPCVIPTE